MTRKTHLSLLFGLTTASIAIGALTFATTNSNLKIAKGTECEHKNVMEYDALSPSLSGAGHVHHYACCDCHTAWQDEAKTIVLGNTLTNRDSIDIYQKTNSSAIDSMSISEDDLIKYVVSSSPYVVGLDQTNWNSNPNGKGSGTYSYYSVDTKKALRVSAETLGSSNYSSLDTSNNGYSEFRFAKNLEGKLCVSFDYKYYDLDTSKHNDEPRIQAVWIDHNLNSIPTEIDLVSDNHWHSYSFTINQGFKSEYLAFKIHHYKGEMYLSNLSVTSPELDAPELVQEGLTVKFNSVANADYYLIHDNINYPNEIRIDDSESVNGVITYRPKTAGKHNIYVTAHNSNSLFTPSQSNVVHNLEVNPVFFYDNFANEYYVKKDYFVSKAKWTLGTKHELYTYKDKFALNDDGSYYHSYFSESGEFTQNAADRIRYATYEEGSNLYRIIEEAKELGTNVLYVPHNDGILKSNQTLEQNTELKAIMDAAYLNNLKVVVIANEIYGVSINGTSLETTKSLINSYLSTYALSLIQHPAFYGFALNDEPRQVDGDKEPVKIAAWAAKACIDFFNENYISLSLNVERPFFICALLQYTDASDGLFQSESVYKNYVRTWLNTTGLNYYSTDIYTYTTQYYGNGSPEVIDLNYKIFLDLKSEYYGLKMHLTVTSNNDIDDRSSCNQYDIFGSTLYAAAFNNFGISRYTYFPAIWTYHWKNGVVNRDGSKTDKYNYVKEAQTQFRLLEQLLYGYEATSMNYSTKGKYGASSANTRIIESNLSNGTNNCTMVVNYNSQSNYNSSFRQYIPEGSIYYLFGQNKNTSANISSGIYVTLTNGQGVLIKEEESPIRDVVLSARDFAANFGEIGSDCTDMSLDTSGDTLKLTITGSAPGVWLNHILNGVSTFVDILHASNNFDVVYRATMGKTAAIRTVTKVGSNYYGNVFDGETTSGSWDSINISGLNMNLTDIRLEFKNGFAASGSLIEIKEIVFHDVECAKFTNEVKYQPTVIDTLTQISGFEGQSAVTITSNNQYESDMTYANDFHDSYIFKFKYSYQQNIDSLFFFIGCQSWKGFEFIILGNKATQIDVYDANASYVGGSGQSFYHIDQTNTDYDIEFHIIRLKNGSNKVFLGVVVNGLYWNEMLIDDPAGCKNNVMGIYDYGANSGAGTTLKNY